MPSTHLGNFYLKNAHPHDIALVYYDQSITYGELDRKINHWASYLLASGINHGDRVALCCHNSPDFIYAYFAVAKIGAIIVPINLMLTADEIQYILTHSNTKQLIIHENIAQKLNIKQWKKTLNLEAITILDEPTLHKLNTYPIKSLQNIDPNSVCAFLYTSGTTGNPKAAMLSHHNLLTNASSCDLALEGTGDDTFLCMLPMFHSFGFTVCVMLPLYTGSTIIIHESFSPKEMINSIVEKGVTVLPAVPAMYVVLSQALKGNPTKLSNLRLAVSGGAPLPREILKLFIDDYQIPLLEGYGLTEASPVVSFNPLSGVKKTGSVGLPLQNIKLKIIGEHDHELPCGEIGEILIKGPNVMVGYHTNPTETEETLRDGWLYSGDIGYLDEDGYLFIVDRKKDLIITSGLNVYPREIEEILYTHPNVLEAAVIGSPEPTRGEVVKAIIVPKEDHLPTKEEIIAFLQNKIASYKLPRFVEFVEQLPKNAGGKIMKRLLK